MPKNKPPSIQKEMARLGLKVQEFLVVLLIMMALLYFQAKYFPWKEPNSGIDASPTPSGVISFQDGDIIFHQATGELPEVISGVTGSPINHCGMIILQGEQVMVIEASIIVEMTPVDEWIRRGNNQHFALLRSRKIPGDKFPLIVDEAKKFLGLPYDFQYELSDEKIYCSELIYKAYQRGAGVKTGKIQRLGDLDYKGHEEFIERLVEGLVPLERELITPMSIYMDPKLSVIYDDFNLRKVEDK